MNNANGSSRRREAGRGKQRVALLSVLAAVALTVFKLVVGLATNSLGILAEAAHSGFDLVATAITFWAVRMASQPADPRHTYGHGKFENLSALVEMSLLLITCVWILAESAHRLFFAAEATHVEASFAAFLVVIVSITVDVSRCRALSRAAREHQSQALEADALHFRTDIWSSAVVLVGLLSVLAGQRFGAPWLKNADSVAALGVALIVAWVGVGVGRKAAEDLLDAIPTHLQERVAAVTAAVPGVEGVQQVRLRKSGAEIFADVTLSVDRGTTLERSHQIADQAETAVRAILLKADVVVHVEPVAPEHEDLLTTIRVVAARHGLGAHGMRIYGGGQRPSLELHVEVDESLLLEQAHRLASEFEDELRSVCGFERIVTHLEPAGRVTASQRAEPAGQSLVRQAIGGFLRSCPLPVQSHDLEVQQTGDELAVSFHCTLDPAISIGSAHELTEQLEKHLRARVPSLGRVVIHVEPANAPSGV